MRKLSFLKVASGLLAVCLSVFAQADWSSINQSVELNQSRILLDRKSRLLYSYVTLTNSSSSDIVGDIRLKVANATKPVLNHDGTTDDGQVFFLLTNNTLLAGETETIRVNFPRQRGAILFESTLEKQGFIVSNKVIDYNPPSAALIVSEEGVEYVDGAFVVWLHERSLASTAAIEALALDIDASVQGMMKGENVYLLRVNSRGNTLATMQAKKNVLLSNQMVEHVSVNYVSTVNSLNATDDILTPDAPISQYYLKESRILEAWAHLAEKRKPIGNTTIPIGVIDVAITQNHEDLDAESYEVCSLTSSCSRSILRHGISAESDSLESTSPNHGNFVTGIIGATHGNEKGISGIMHNKIIHTYSVGFANKDNVFSNMAKMGFFVDENLKGIMNFSFGSGDYTTSKDGITYCIMPLSAPNMPFQGGVSVLDENSYCLKNPRQPLPGVFLPSEIAGFASDMENRALELEKVAITIYGTIINRSLRLGGDLLLVQSSGNSNIPAHFNGGACSIPPDTFYRGVDVKKHVLCVGSIDKALTPPYQQSSFSNYGERVDLLAFGSEITGVGKGDDELLFDNSGYDKKKNGTSFSAPIVTGVAGLIWNAYPDLTAQDVKRALIEVQGYTHTSEKEGVSAPVLDAYEALLFAEEISGYTPNITEIPELTPQAMRLYTFSLKGAHLDLLIPTEPENPREKEPMARERPTSIVQVTSGYCEPLPERSTSEELFVKCFFEEAGENTLSVIDPKTGELVSGNNAFIFTVAVEPEMFTIEGLQLVPGSVSPSENGGFDYLVELIGYYPNNYPDLLVPNDSHEECLFKSLIDQVPVFLCHSPDEGMKTLLIFDNVYNLPWQSYDVFVEQLATIKQTTELSDFMAARSKITLALSLDKKANGAYATVMLDDNAAEIPLSLKEDQLFTLETFFETAGNHTLHYRLYSAESVLIDEATSLITLAAYDSPLVIGLIGNSMYKAFNGTLKIEGANLPPEMDVIFEGGVCQSPFNVNYIQAMVTCTPGEVGEKTITIIDRATGLAISEGLRVMVTLPPA
jgi:subtilisin family serine protease